MTRKDKIQEAFSIIVKSGDTTLDVILFVLRRIGQRVIITESHTPIEFAQSECDNALRVIEEYVANPDGTISPRGISARK